MFPDVNWKESLVGKRVEPARFVRGSLKQIGEKGEVKVVLVVSPTGSVDIARVLSSTNPKLDRFVIDSVKAWRFTSGRVDGRPAAFMYVYPIAFE